MARLDDAALAQHDAALLQASDPQRARQLAVRRVGQNSAAAATMASRQAASPAIDMAAPRAFGLPVAAAGGFGFSVGAAAAAGEEPEQFQGGGGGGVAAASAPSKLSPLAAAAGQRRRRSGLA